MATKISELTESTSVDRSADYLEISRDDGAGGYSSRRISPDNLGIQNPAAVNITGGNVRGLTRFGFDSEYDNGKVSANTTIDWANGNYQRIEIADASAVTLSFANMPVGRCQLKVVAEHLSTYLRPTLPAGLWAGGSAGTFSATLGAIDLLDIYYDGTNYYYTLTNDWKSA